MADEKATESAQVAPEAEEKPAPRVPSAASEDQRTSRPEDSLDRLEALVDDAVSRKQQSIKDKRIAKLEKQLQSLLEASDEAPSESAVPGRTAPVEDEDGAFMEAMSEQILVGAGMALDDPEYEELVDRYEGKITNPDRWERVLREFATSHKNKDVKRQTVTEAAKAPSTAEAADIEGGDAESVAGELAALQLGQMGDPFSPANRKRQEELIAKLNELEPQVDVDDPNVRVDTSALHQGYVQ